MRVSKEHGEKTANIESEVNAGSRDCRESIVVTRTMRGAIMTPFEVAQAVTNDWTFEEPRTFV